MEGYVESTVFNLLGHVYVYTDADKCFCGIGDYCEDIIEEVSKEFYDAFVKEFGEK